MRRELVELFGGLTYIFIWISVLTGLIRWKFHLFKIPAWVHFTAAIIVVLTGTAHLILIATR